MMDCFALKDLKTGHFMTPFFKRHVAEAIREIIAAAEMPQSMISRFPSDYALYRLSAFDEQQGAFYSDALPGFIASVAALVDDAKVQGVKNVDK